MNLSSLQLVLIVMVSMLLGMVVTFSFFYLSDLKLVIGSTVICLALLIVLALQLRGAKAE